MAGSVSGVLVENGAQVASLARAVSGGRHGIATARNIVCTLVRGEGWRDFIVPGTGEHIVYGPDEFARFVTTQPFEGLGVDVATLEALCRGDREAEAALDRARTPLAGHGTNQWGGGSIATSTVDRGRDYTLRRLKRDAPALAERVIAGELSANAAALAAGIRHRPTPLEAALRAWRRLGDDDRAAFVAALRDEGAVG